MSHVAYCLRCPRTMVADTPAGAQALADDHEQLQREQMGATGHRAAVSPVVQTSFAEADLAAFRYEDAFWGRS